MRRRAEGVKGLVKDWLPLVISVAALVVSFVNLYITNFRPARVRAKAGEYVDLGLLREGNFYASVPIAFSNDGSRSSIITKVALLVVGGQGRESYLFEPVDYQRLGEDFLYVPESAPAPITLKGGDNVVKQVRFRSPLGMPAPLQVYGPGRHDLALLAWLDDADDPVVLERFSVKLPETLQAEIKNALDQNAQKAPDDATRVGADERVSLEGRGRIAAGPVDEETVKRLGGR